MPPPFGFKPAPFAGGLNNTAMAARFALGVEYDGNDFCGWQSQDCGCGAQDALQTALSAIADSPIKVWAAGRTDAGVHATAADGSF